MNLSRRAALQTTTTMLVLGALQPLAVAARTGERRRMAGGMVLPPTPYAMHDAIIDLKLGTQGTLG